MIKTELITIDDETKLRTYSDSGYYVHGGFPEKDYAEADDPLDSGRTYIETNRKIINGEVIDYATIGIILIGEENHDCN